MDVEALLPPVPAPPAVAKGARRFDALPTVSEAGKNLCPTLPPGVLLSEADYTEALAERIACRRLRIENGILWRLRGDERTAAEQLLAVEHAKVEQLEGKLAGARRWNKLHLIAGVAVGAGGFLLASWAVNRVSR